MDQRGAAGTRVIARDRWQSGRTGLEAEILEGVQLLVRRGSTVAIILGWE